MEGHQGHEDGEDRKVREEGGEGRGAFSLTNLVGGSSSNPSQMIIHYDGLVRVFNLMTLEKAQAIMLMAAATEAAAAVPEIKRAPSLESSTAGVDVAPPPPQQQHLLPTDIHNPLCKLRAELPIARRNSLQRFLEKRRERLVSKAPYLVSKTPKNPSDGCSGNEPSTTPSSSFKGTAMSP